MLQITYKSKQKRLKKKCKKKLSEVEAGDLPGSGRD